MPTKFGVQPARRIFAEKCLVITGVAHQIGVGHQHLNRVVNGRTPPSDAVRERLPEFIGVPLEELFTPELLSTPFGKVGRKPVAK